MSTHEQISAAIKSIGYRDAGDHRCRNNGCENLLDHAAIRGEYPGCFIECRACIEKRLRGDTIEQRLAAARAKRKYPTEGRILADDPSIYGHELLGHEGETWASFTRGNEPQHSPAEPYRRGIGQGFGATEDGDV